MKTVMLSRRGLLVTTDSAHVPHAMPMFLPDWEGVQSWRGEFLLAVRIGRLGKNIAPKFSPRHIDGITVAMRLDTPDVASDKLQRLAIADNSLAMGQWESWEERQEFEICIHDGMECVTLTAQKVLETISHISHYTTLKTGDTICLATTLGQPLNPNDTVTATLNDKQVLSLRVK